MLGFRPRDAARPHLKPIMSFPDEDDFHRLLDALTTCVLLHDAHTKAIVGRTAPRASRSVFPSRNCCR